MPTPFLVNEMKINVVQLELKRAYEMELPVEDTPIFIAKQAAPIFCHAIGGKNVEHTAMICLNNANRVINFFTVSIGEINSVKVSLAQMFRTTLLSNASKIMVAHNHPSGVLEVTTNDIELTKKIGFFANAFSMDLIDSLVVTSEDFISIRSQCKEFINGRENSTED